MLTEKEIASLSASIPPDVIDAHRIVPPRVCWNGEFYIVELYVYNADPNHLADYGEAPVDYLTFNRFFIGEGVYRSDAKEIWRTPLP